MNVVIVGGGSAGRTAAIEAATPITLVVTCCLLYTSPSPRDRS